MVYRVAVVYYEELVGIVGLGEGKEGGTGEKTMNMCIDDPTSSVC